CVGATVVVVVVVDVVVVLSVVPNSSSAALAAGSDEKSSVTSTSDSELGGVELAAALASATPGMHANKVTMAIERRVSGFIMFLAFPLPDISGEARCACD